MNNTVEEDMFSLDFATMAPSVDGEEFSFDFNMEGLEAPADLDLESGLEFNLDFDTTGIC